MDDLITNKDEQKLIRLLNQKIIRSVLLSRRLVAQGEDWAEEYLNKARLGLN